MARRSSRSGLPVVKRERGRWTPELEAEILAKRDAGRTIESIAGDYNLSTKRMGAVLQRARLMRDPPKPLFKRIFGKGSKA